MRIYPHLVPLLRRFPLLAVLAAVVSVTPDWINMLALAVPLWALYEVGIVLCRRSPPALAVSEDGTEM
jgi:Sec-independent protein secretion pathway component TatC